MKLKLFGVKGLAIALALSMAPAAVPAGTPFIGKVVSSQAQAQQIIIGGGSRYYRGDRSYRGGRYRGDRRYYRRDRGRDSGAAAIIGGIVGLGIGAAIASQPRYYERPRVYRSSPRYSSSYSVEPWTSEWYSYCSSRYRSFDPRSGTYQPYQGRRRFCS